MRDFRNRLRAAVVLCAAGPVASFLPSFLPARAATTARAGAGGSIESSCAGGVPNRRGAFRAPVASTRLEAAADQPDGQGHALRDGEGQQGGGVSTIDGSSEADSPKGGDSLSSSSGTPVSPTSSAAAAAAAAAADSMDGRSSQVVGEGEAGQAPSMAAVAREMDTAAGGVGQSSEEEQAMAEMLAQQPGGQEEAMAMAVEEGQQTPAPTKRVRKRLKKYFPKDFQDTTWTVAVQWNHAKYEVQTTKFALKADGSVVWLDKGKGSWIMRTKSRDISIYRNFFLNWGGMRIYSAKLLNNTCDMYLSGVIKGWQPFLPLSKMGTWQAVRRGITVDENTPRPPWESKEVVGEVTFGDGRSRENKPIEIDVDLQ